MRGTLGGGTLGGGKRGGQANFSMKFLYMEGSRAGNCFYEFSLHGKGEGAGRKVNIEFLILRSKGTFPNSNLAKVNFDD